MKFIIGKEYQTDVGALSYGGFFRIPGYRCSTCKQIRNNIHEFYKGPKDNPNLVYFYGTECIKKIIGMDAKSKKSR